MNLDDLKVIRSNERSTRKLTQLKPDFYVDVKTYLDSLRTAKDQKKKDELENALSVIEAIYDKRVVKIIRLASLRAKGLVENVPLTGEELQIYDGIYQLFTGYRDLMLGEGESGEVSNDETDSLTRDMLPSDDLERGRDGALPEGAASNVKEKRTVQVELATESETGEDVARGALMGEEVELDDTRTLIQESKNIKYLKVRILADIPAFIGLDGRNYKLSNEDVVVLPEGNAKTLCNRNLAVQIGDLS